MDFFPPQLILIALAVGVSSGAVGAFIILKRMALVGDALSHVALPGIALALFYNIDPLWGVLVFLAVAAVLVWWLEERTRLPGEALVGLLFTSSLAVGILTIPDSEILESLFGELQELSTPALWFFLGVAAALTFFTFFFARRFIFSIISPELSRVGGNSRFYDLILMLIFSLTVALGIKLVGALLMGALTIIPAVTVKNIARSMAGFLIMSSVWGGFLAVVGLAAAKYFQFLPGPTIVILGVGVFIVSLWGARKT